MKLFCSFQLHKKVETLQEENHKLSELASEAEYLAGVLKVGLPLWTHWGHTLFSRLIDNRKMYITTPKNFAMLF